LGGYKETIVLLFLQRLQFTLVLHFFILATLFPTLVYLSN